MCPGGDFVYIKLDGATTWEQFSLNCSWQTLIGVRIRRRVNQVEHPETRKDILKPVDNKSPTANQTTQNEVQSTPNFKHVTSGFVFYSAKWSARTRQHGAVQPELLYCASQKGHADVVSRLEVVFCCAWKNRSISNIITCTSCFRSFPESDLDWFKWNPQ